MKVNYPKKTKKDVEREKRPPPFKFRPHDGAQTRYFKSDAKIIVAGGGAGGGKTMALLMDALRGLDFPGYEAAVFRKTLVMHRMGGGLWKESSKYYSKVPGSDPNNSAMEWAFENRCYVKFYGCDDPSKYDGLQTAFLGIDQLEQLTADEFWHLCSRVRTTCGSPTRIRATCNPEPGWLEVLLKSGGYVGQDGLPVIENDGKIRWFVRDQDTDTIVWRDSVEEFGSVDADGMLIDGEYEGLIPTSFTFIRFPLSENKSLDKSYRANLQNMTLIERRKKLEGNWNLWTGGGGVYKAKWWGLEGDTFVESKNLLQSPPLEDVQMCWAFDIGWSSTGDWTVGILFGQSLTSWYIFDMIKFRAREHITFEVVRRCLAATGSAVPLALPRDPGKAGLDQEGWQLELGQQGYQVNLVPDDSKSGDKVERHRFLSPQAETGHLKIVLGYRPSANVSKWLTSVESEPGKIVECTTAHEYARELIQCLDALSPECPHVVTDVTDAVARAHRFMVGDNPAAAARLAASMSQSPDTWDAATDPRAAVSKLAMSQWNKNRPGLAARVVNDKRDWMFHGKRRH